MTEPTMHSGLPVLRLHAIDATLHHVDELTLDGIDLLKSAAVTAVDISIRANDLVRVTVEMYAIPDISLPAEVTITQCCNHEQSGDGALVEVGQQIGGEFGRLLANGTQP